MFIQLKDTGNVCVDLSKVYALSKLQNDHIRFRFQGKNDGYDRQYVSQKERDADYQRIISFLEKNGLMV